MVNAQNVFFLVVFTGIATVYARYKFVEKLSEDVRVVSSRLNIAALAFGIIPCLGMCIVATFQVSVHMWRTF